MECIQEMLNDIKKLSPIRLLSSHGINNFESAMEWDSNRYLGLCNPPPFRIILYLDCLRLVNQPKFSGQMLEFFQGKTWNNRAFSIKRLVLASWNKQIMPFLIFLVEKKKNYLNYFYWVANLFPNLLKLLVLWIIENYF